MRWSVSDLTERKRAEAAREGERRYREVPMELAHANRVATMGHLSTSSAHEVNQPIGAAITYADAGLRWLGVNPPKLEEARQALGFVLESGVRADEVLKQIRALIKEEHPQKYSLDINEVIREIIALTSRQMEKNGISAQTRLAESLPAIQGDRVQQQQVTLNLLIDAIEAMTGMSEGPRELLISTAKSDVGVVVSVRDSGPRFLKVSNGCSSFLRYQAWQLGVGVVDLPFDHRSAWRKLVGSANEPRGAEFNSHRRRSRCIRCAKETPRFG